MNFKSPRSSANVEIPPSVQLAADAPALMALVFQGQLEPYYNPFLGAASPLHVSTRGQ
jgi:hypothetical protein